MTGILSEKAPGAACDVRLEWEGWTRRLCAEFGWHRPHPNVLRDGFDRLGRELAASGIRAWGDPMAHAVARAFRPMAHDVPDPSPDRRDTLAALRLGWALAMGDASAVHPGEADALAGGDPTPTRHRERRDRLAAAARAAAGPSAGGRTPLAPFTVPFAFRHDRNVAGRAIPTLAHGTAFLVPVDGADAPVVALLRAASGPPLPIRAWSGDLVRPVLAPGGRDHVDPEGFAVATCGGAAWGDDPFAPIPAEGSLLALRHHAPPPPGRGPSRAAAAAVAATGQALASVAGPFPVIDGVVHRRCAEPTLHLSFDGSDGMAFSWDVPGQFSGDDDMGPLRLGRERRRRVTPPYEDPAPCLSPPLSWWATAGAVLEGIAAALGAPAPEHPAGGPAWEVLRPDLLPPDPGWPYKALAGWASMADPDGEDPLSTAFARGMRAAASEARDGGPRAPVPEDMPFPPTGSAARLAAAAYGPLAALAAGAHEPIDGNIALFTP